MAASKYETFGGTVTRAGTYLKVLDLLDQLTDHARQMQPSDADRTTIYNRMLDTIDQLIDQSAVIAHLHNTETTTRDRALNQGWLAYSFAFQTIRNIATNLTKLPPHPQAWRDMTTQLEQMKYKIKVLTESKLN